MTIELPEFEDIAAKAPEQRTALERFIYDNEPNGMIDAEEFRAGLAAVLENDRAKYLTVIYDARLRLHRATDGYSHGEFPDASWGQMQKTIRDLDAVLVPLGINVGPAK